MRPADETYRPIPAASEAQILTAIELELATQRARRRPGSGTATVLLRWFSVILLLGLLAAGLGAMWYLQTVAAEHPPVHRATPGGTAR